MDGSPLKRVLLVGVAMSLVATVFPAAGAASPPPRARAQVQAPAAHGPAPGNPEAMRPGELLVRATRQGRGLEQALQRSKGRAVAALGGGVTLVAVPPGREAAAAARLSDEPGVVYAEPNYVRLASAHAGDEIDWGIASTRAPELWDRPTPVRGSGARVAVLDSGVYRAHRQLRTRVDNGFDAYKGRGTDDCGHGTAVAGVVAAAHDGIAPVGVAPEATIVPVRVLRFDKFFGVCGGDDAAIIRGVRWAADPRGGNADVINMSLSGPQRSRALGDAIAYALSQGVLVVAASGNSGDRTVNYPAAYPGVISVGGIQQSGGGLQWWPHTSFGSVDIAAPARRVRVLLSESVRLAPGRIWQPCPGGGWCADGTSFAAPHVAGLAALLLSQHPELDALGPAARLRRLRQWILATAPRVPKRPGGVDLKTGHGRPDAVRAADASVDASRVLVSWEAGPRVLAPARRMVATPARLGMKLTATTGTGEPLQGEEVVFTAPPGGSVGVSRTVTNRAGVAATTVRSVASGRVARLQAALGTRTLSIDNYVLHRDDNVPGVRPPSTVFRDSLNLAVDVDDVYRFRLRAGETLRARASGIRRGREQVLLYLHGASTKDVTNPYRAPLDEDPGFGEPHRLSRTVSSDGVRYLDVFGFGTYRLRWWILSPDAIRNLTASPATFTPDGDGVRDRTTLGWRVGRRGQVTLGIRNADGALVRRIAYGVRPRGLQSYRWNGRIGDGRLAPAGTYRAAVQWSDGRGRTWKTGTKITLRR